MRLPDNSKVEWPGDYAWMDYSTWEHKPPYLTDEGEWHMIDPNGGMGAIRSRNHSWEEHEDGTVSFFPSLIMPSGWHGYLTKGEWIEL